MSEFQYVGFRAAEKPVSAKNLEFMRRQSTRAEITPWTFDNDYHFGDFRGDAEEMVRRGYDVHLHYANFGIRRLLIRIPFNLPDAPGAAPYFVGDGLGFIKDKAGPAGILCVSPVSEPGELDDLWEPAKILDRLVPLRAEILAGDLRPLYLAHLAVLTDGNHDPEEETEGPVPAGLGKLTDAQQALAELYAFNDSFLAAAAAASPKMRATADPQADLSGWLQGVPQATKDAWLLDWLADAQSAARGDMLAELRKSKPSSAWPTVVRGRTIAELEAATDEIHQEQSRKATEKAQRDRDKRLADMAADPTPTLRKTEQLVKGHSRESYSEIAELLAELREALSGTKQSGLAEQQAQKLKRENPTLHVLTSELRKAGFIPK